MSIQSQQTKLNIGLFGFGVVGESLYHVLQETPSLNASIKKVCIKHPEKKRKAPESFFTTDPEALLNDESINVIVELIDDVLMNHENEAKLTTVRSEVNNWMQQYPLFAY